jgi:membrane-associated phospholipid phosphatase
MKRLLKSFRIDLSSQTATLVATLWNHRRLITWSMVLCFAILEGLMIEDKTWLFQIQEAYHGNPNFPKFLSKIGEFQFSTLSLSLLLWLLGKVFYAKRLSLTQASRACLVAGLLSGVTATILRPAIGRARPFTEEVASFHPLSLRHKYQSYPSGHVLTSGSSLLAVASKIPVLMPVAVGTTALIAWSRMALNKHYPSDVMSSMVLSVLIAWLVNRATGSSFD